MNVRIVCVLMSAVLALGAGAVEFTVDFSKETGNVRRINGIGNLSPLSSSKGGKYKGILKPLEAPRTHLHDDALQSPGYALVDVSRIFPLFHADPDDPRNYNFRPTDDYLRTAIDEGIEIDFRLGEAIEHSENHYRVKPPADFIKWADICSHIIRHYNEGWADGFKWNIRYWSIWEEPDNVPSLIDAPNGYRGAYFDLYRTVAPILKQRFPDIRISGPQCCGSMKSITDFVRFCAKEKLPLDVLAWTSYCLEPESYALQVDTARKCLDENGFKDTEIDIVEWHYGPVSWQGHGGRMAKLHSEEWRRHLNSAESAAFTTATLSLMQDHPVDMMNFYSLKSASWGIFDMGMQPLPPYYSLVAFAETARGGTRVAAPVKPADGWYALASKEENGRGHLLVSAFKSYGDVKVKVAGGMRPARVRIIDAINRLDEDSNWKWDAGTSTLSIPRIRGDSAVWLVDFERPPKVIFDTDMLTDFDDVGALACLHALADAGECEILATVSCTRGNASVAAIEVINSYYRRGELPVGVPKGMGVIGDRGCTNGVKLTAAEIAETMRTGNDRVAKGLAEGGHFKYRKLAADYPKWVRHADSDDAPDANLVYRRALAAAPDKSVVICSVGFLTNLRRLLETQPDDISPLDGRTLVAKKVKKWVAMACKYPQGTEYNSMMDPESSRIALSGWPTPVVISDWEYGADVYAGRAIAEMKGPRNPVKDVFKGNIPSADAVRKDPGRYQRQCFGLAGRSAWDETAVLAAVRGEEKYFNIHRGEYRMTGSVGENVWVPDEVNGRHVRITEKMNKLEVGKVIDELICRGPKNSGN